MERGLARAGVVTLSDGFGWVEKDRELHRRDLARAYGFAKRKATPADAAPGQVLDILNVVGRRRLPAASAERLDDRDPATGRLVARIPRSGRADVAAAVAAAKAAQPAWAATPLSERCAVLRRAGDLVQQRAEELARLEALDTGKPIGLARNLDVPRAALNLRFFADFALEEAGEGHAMPGHLNRTVRDPVGVVALVTPWNLPLYLLTWKAAPALAMGNAVVAKPSELTPLSADALAGILLEAGLPAGAFNVVHGLGPEAGQALVEHPDVRAVSFTGGTATGRKVAASAAAGLKKCSLELGGKNPAIVFADCDMEATVRGVARAAFTNTGQVCLCASRVLVEASAAPEFTRRLAAAAKALRVGDPMDASTDVGSLVSEQHRAKVEGHVEQARREGGQVLAGGGRPALPPPWSFGAFLEPTVIAGLPQSSACVQEEVFGPVVTVQPFADEAEALRLANGVRYGLAASVWTQDAARAARLSDALRVGMVWVNCWLVRDLRVPFGGVKESGLGREGGRHSLDFFSEPKNVCVKLSS